MSPCLKSCCSCIPQRWIFTILASVALCLQCTFSVIMFSTIVEMVVRFENLEEPDTEICQTLNVSLLGSQIFISKIENQTSMNRYPWDAYTQGIILSSFSWTIVFAAFIYGTLAQRFGGKHILGFGILVQSVLTFVTPFVIDWSGSTGLIIIRVITGLGSDGMFAVVTAMIPKWSTPADRTTIGSTIYAGSTLGLFFGTISPALIMKYSGMGWPAVFYFFGIVEIIWFVLWLVLVYENPKVHPFISEKEIEYLRSTLREKKLTNSKLPSPPWKNMLSCKEFWVYCIMNIGGNCTFYVLLSCLPRYMVNVINFPIDINGYFSSLAYVLVWLNCQLSAWIIDKIQEQRWISLTNLRKIFSTISVIGPGTFLLLASYAGCNRLLVVVMLMIGVPLLGSASASFVMNPVDLSPNYAGTLMSFGAAIAAMTGLFVPYFIGIMVPNSTLNEWRLVFWIMFLFAGVCNFIYILWFKAEVQPWDDPNFARKEMQNVIEREEEVELKLMS